MCDSSYEVLFLKIFRDPLDFVHDAQQIATPEFFDLLFGVAAADELQSYVEGFAGVVPTDDSATTVEVGGDADVVDAD